MKKAKEPVSAFKAILISSAVSLALVFVLCLLCASFLQSKASPESFYKITSVIVPATASLIGGLLCALLSKGKGLIRGFFVGILAGLLINLVGIVLAPKSSPDFMGILMPFICSSLSGALGGFLGVNLIKR